MGVVAAALTSCGSEPDRRCVDRDSYDSYGGYEIIDDNYCESDNDTYANASWYYGGHSGHRSGSDGSFHKSAVDRGGIGCSASGSGGG